MSTSGNTYAYASGAQLTFAQNGGATTGAVTMGAAYTTAALASDDLNANATFNTKFLASVVGGNLTITSLSTTLTNDSTNGITVNGTGVTGTGTSTSQKAFSSSGTAISTDGPEVAATGVTDGLDTYAQVSTTNNVVTTIGALDFSSAAKAALAIIEIDDQISAVSTARAELGADQNRFESVIKNLAVSKENLTAAGSRIRDTDMAEEMVKYTRANILSQAGTAMLAQANQSNSGVLQLLQ
ncbi:flagellin [Cryobacterium sp. Y82]|uniref:flagellin n=1 Tax=Cryobacterium sp. Y82 TaxID=2045017 RepID=UPI003511FC9F